jgi:hypothetical protein
VSQPVLVTGGTAILPTKPPLDPFPYPQQPDSRPFAPQLEPGSYVYAQDADGVVWVAPDGPHMHPQILGGAKPVAGAGELTVEAGGVVTEVNNISGTFQCGPETLPQVIDALRNQGATVRPDAAKPFHWED